MCEPVLGLRLKVGQVIDLESVRSCCDKVQLSPTNFCPNCGAKQDNPLEATLMHGFRAREAPKLDFFQGFTCKKTVVCGNRVVSLPPGLTLHNRWPVSLVKDRLTVEVARGSAAIVHALSSDEFLSVARSFDIPCAKEDLVIYCPL